MSQRALAIGAHPDDIEFMMAGTMLLLGRAGYELHYLNIANGSLGSSTMSIAETIRVRTAEARRAAALMEATFHEPLVDDLAVYYTPELAARVTAVVRAADPEIVLTLSPCDYMEDHINACRLAVSSAFFRYIPNYATSPQRPPVRTPTAIYHAMPVPLCDPLRRPVVPDLFVDVAAVMERKRQALACHASQKQWLDETQGQDNYLNTMQELCARVGRMSGAFALAEGWQRHSHLGYADADFDPLTAALGKELVRSQASGGRG